MLTNSSQEKCIVGRVGTVLVFGDQENRKAVITSVLARESEAIEGGRLSVVGSASFEDRALAHLSNIVLPIVDRLMARLGVPSKNYELSLVNLAATSSHDRGFKVTGFSADAPTLLSIISAALHIPIANDLACTGHIASPTGDIRLVKALPAKIKAAGESSEIKFLIYPSLDQDDSLDSLASSEKERLQDAIVQSKLKLSLVSVGNIADLISSVFSDEQVVRASLKNGYYEGLPNGMRNAPHDDPALEFLAGNLESRFWESLEYRLMRGQSAQAKVLFEDFISFHLRKKKYPTGIGEKLLRLLRSIPPETRRLKLDFPLVYAAACIELSQFAKKDDLEDVPILLNAISGQGLIRPTSPPQKLDSAETTPSFTSDTKLANLLDNIDPERLSQKIGQPIDAARASYYLDSATVVSNEEFNETIIAFFIHLMRHTGRYTNAVDPAIAGSDAFALLEQAFSRKGGLGAAQTEAKSGIKGGLRLVLDTMTDYFKAMEIEKYINMVIKESLDPCDWDGKVNLIRSLMKMLRDQLPSELIYQPPDKYAKHYELLVKAYVHSLDDIRSVFRSI